MKAKFYQVVGSGPWTIDYPDGRSVSHRPGQIFEAQPTNPSVMRGLRTKPRRLREMSERESDALHAAKVAKILKVVKPKAEAPRAAAPRVSKPALAPPKSDAGSDAK
jgi:hypothetical protein